MNHLQIPDQGVLWDLLLKLLGGMGSVTFSDTGYPVVALYVAAEARILISPATLQRYVGDFVEARAKLGLDDGLASGLPNPLIDSVVELLGSQSPGAFDYELRGLSLGRLG